MTGAWGAGPRDSDAEPSEESLLQGARAGERTAVERLYSDHVASARRLAAILAGAEVAEELVAEAFARVLGQLRTGGGPTTNFRAYLHTTIRNLHRDTLRRSREVPASDRPWLLDETAPPADELVAGFDANGATAALASLPGTWQQVLWHLEVEGRKPAEIAELLATTPAVISSLAYRAREGLRRAFLDQHGGPTPADDSCRWTRARLSQHVRDDLSPRAAAKVTDHLDRCPACAEAHTEMSRLNMQFAAYLFPVVLVGAMHALDGLAEGAPAAAGGPEQLVTELAARADGTPVAEAAAAAAGSGPGGSPGLSRRVSLVAAAVVAGLVAITATTFALTGGDDAPDASDTSATGDAGGDRPTLPVVPTPTPSATAPEIPPPALSPTGIPGLPAPSTSSGSVAAPVPALPPGPTDAPGPTRPVPTPPGSVPPPPTPGLPPPTTVPPPAEPGVIQVRPVAPSAAPITRCGTYGSLGLPRTRGVRYTQTLGDGREGSWAVVAAAVPGYLIADGAPTRFSGDLGRFQPCPVRLQIRQVTTTATGSSANDPWRVTVTPTAPDQERRVLSVTYWFDTRVEVVRREGAGWTCRDPGGSELAAGSSFEAGARLRCSFEPRGTRPTPVSLLVRALDRSGSAARPSGTAALTADGDVVDIEDFDSVDR